MLGIRGACDFARRTSTQFCFNIPVHSTSERAASQFMVLSRFCRTRSTSSGSYTTFPWVGLLHSTTDLLDCSASTRSMDYQWIRVYTRPRSWTYHFIFGVTSQHVRCQRRQHPGLSLAERREIISVDHRLGAKPRSRYLRPLALLCSSCIPHGLDSSGHILEDFGMTTHVRAFL